MLHLLKKSIPNIFTSLNFLCGCFASYLAFKNLFEAAFLLVLFGTFFDLFDGFFARIFKVESDFGLQFDSMADLITSGMAPGIVMYNLFMETGVNEFNYTIYILKNEFTFSLFWFVLIIFPIKIIFLGIFNFNTFKMEKRGSLIKINNYIIRRNYNLLIYDCFSLFVFLL